MCCLVRLAGKDPNNVWWNDVVQAAVERKVIGPMNEVVMKDVYISEQKGSK